MVIIPANDHEPFVIREFTAPPELKFLNAAVGGPIESVPYFSRYGQHACWAICNEEGKSRGKPLNQRADVLWHNQFRNNPDHLVGDVAVLYGDEDFMSSL
jgi:hypothetical protein